MTSITTQPDEEEQNLGIPGGVITNPASKAATLPTMNNTTTIHDEKEMRESKVPRLETASALSEYIASLVEGQHDYGTCVYAMSLSAVAAFNYAAHKLGVTGFQASCADLDIIKRTRHIDGPFMLMKGEDMLYPQHDPYERLIEAEREWEPWLKEQALKKLAEHNEAHPNVLRHWARLAYNGSNPLESGKIEAKAAFLENEFTEDFIASHVAQFKQFGITHVYLRGEGDVSKAQSCKEGASFRINLPVSLQFEYEIDGITVSWSVDTEKPGSNGAGELHIDFGKLDALTAKAAPNVAQALREYVTKAREANSVPDGNENVCAAPGSQKSADSGLSAVAVIEEEKKEDL